MSIFEDFLDMHHVEQEPDYRVDAKGVRCIRRAITFGIHALVQVEKARQAQTVAEELNRPWPEDVRLVMPAESFCSTMEEIADALLWIEYGVHVKEVSHDSAAAE
ncbi:hypothetical protein [Stenotrophomonas rhizophila]